MTSANLVQLAYVAESTWGTTPTTPQMNLLRFTSESLNFDIDYVTSTEITPSRQPIDVVNVGYRASGSINFELSSSTFDDFMASVACSPWTNMPVIINATADTEITGVTDSDDTFAVASGGGSFVAGHILRTTGFTNAANNSIFRVSSSTSSTVVVGGTPTLTNESAPPAGAKMQVIGFQGASGDITASSTGLASTTLDFTTLGLVVGQWVKIGGSATGDKFATAALNGWARITAVAAHALTLDNRPTGWTTDAGASKTIKVWCGDYIRIGTSSNLVQKSFSIEKGFLGQVTPNYVVYAGMVVGQMTLTFRPGAILTGSMEFMGKAASISTTALDATPTAVTATDVLNSVSDVGVIAEGGSRVASPNYVQEFSCNIVNTLIQRTGVGNAGLVGIGHGRELVTGKLSTYFGDATQYTKFINDTESSIACQVGTDGAGYMFTVPRMKFSASTIVAGGADQDVLADGTYSALYDTTTATSLQVDRLAYYE